MKVQLRFRTGHHSGQVLEFKPPRTLILGRASQSDVQIYDERISRRHCAIRIDELGVRLKDLGSGNGTYVNGAEATDAVLSDGDVFSLGRTEIQVRFVRATDPADGAATEPQLAAVGAPPQASAAAAAVPCAHCQEPIPPEHLKLAGRHRERFICFRCAPRVEVPGYRLERNLGEGAMGVVFLALDLRTGAPAAIKVLKARGSISAEDRARFAREVQTSAELEHPNIIRIIDHGEAPGGILYYIMEYVPGKSLKEWIDAYGPLPLPSALRVSVQVAQALEHARVRSIVHRDIKPDNIIVQGDGHAKLADFGLAKSTLAAGASGLTRPGDGLGTLPYMPPEQIQDALYADHRSDIYSLGATIYHMLTARAPFAARTPLEYFRLIRSEAPPPIFDVREDVPVVIVNMVSKAMAKNADDRYQSATEMIAVMQQFLRSAFDSRQTAG